MLIHCLLQSITIQGLFLDDSLSIIEAKGMESLPLPYTPVVDSLKTNYLLPYSDFRLKKDENQNSAQSRNPAYVTDLLG